MQRVYRGLADYAADARNFEPQVRAAIASMPTAFPAIAATLAWGRVDFLSDLPGKNDGRAGLEGGGLTTRALAALVEGARSEVLIQSPYLVLSDPALELLGRLRARGVEVRISTNSLASTDNLPAFSGYRNQREALLRLGLKIHEYRPDPAVQREVMQRYERLKAEAPVFVLHAKTLVVDRRAVFVGTYNLDPRSENLNTEVGVVIHDAGQARAWPRRCGWTCVRRTPGTPPATIPTPRRASRNGCRCASGRRCRCAPCCRSTNDMALGATIYTFLVTLNDADRGVYESLEFSRGGLSDPDAPALAVRDLTGALQAWIEVGAPEPARLHKATKAARRVAVYTHREVASWLARLAADPPHRAADIEIFALDRELLAALSARLDRRMAFDLSVSEGHLYLTLADATLDGVVARHRIGDPA